MFYCKTDKETKSINIFIDDKSPLIRFYAFFQESEVFKQELWNLMINFRTNKYEKPLEKCIKEYLYNIYKHYNEFEEVNFVVNENLKENVSVICDFLNYVKRIKTDDERMFNLIFKPVTD